MAEVQDEEQWLYGDDKGEPPSENNADGEVPTAVIKPDPDLSKSENEAVEETSTMPVSADAIDNSGHVDAADEEQQENSSDDDDDDEPTVTIGKIVKQPDIVRPPPPTHRAAPTSGVKDDDFNSAGKINGVPVAEFDAADLEEKPWRKPGADLSDYFNYGFNEDTWIKYCERQKAMRVHESSVGLASLGINVGPKNFTPAFIQNNKYDSGPKIFAGGQTLETNGDGARDADTAGKSIQVMTAERRVYGSKGPPQSHSYDMDFGLPTGADYMNIPPPFYSQRPPPTWESPVSVPPPPWGSTPVGVPPPSATLRSVYEGGDSAPLSSYRRSRSKSRDRELDRLSPREMSRRHRRRTRSRSRSRSRSRGRRRSRSRSRSRSPQKHKRKKSKRDRDD